MAYDALDFLRIEWELHALAGGDVWDRIEDGLWLQRAREHAAWSAHGQWWRRTTGGKRAAAARSRARRAELATIVVAVRGCKACGRLFPITAAQRQHGRGRVCSEACRGRARQNVELVYLHGEALPLARWAERYGLPLGTVCRRRKLGWSLLDALTRPCRGKGRVAA
jgi:hypothetical protein